MQTVEVDLNELLGLHKAQQTALESMKSAYDDLADYAREIAKENAKLRAKLGLRAYDA